MDTYGDNSFCTLCRVELNTHKNDLRKYACTAKLKRKVAKIADLALTRPIPQAFRPAVS